MTQSDETAAELIADWISEGTEDLPNETPVRIKIGERTTVYDTLGVLRSAIVATPEATEGALKLGHTPTYGRCTANDMLAAVADAIYADRDHERLRLLATNPTYSVGHQMVPAINFNSLNRIISAFHPAPEASGGCLQDVVAMSMDVESDRVLQLHFSRPVTDDDRARLVKLHNDSIKPEVRGGGLVPKSAVWDFFYGEKRGHVTPEEMSSFLELDTPKPEATPVAWVIPGDDNARDDGFLDAMAWREGEFTKPLYAHPPKPEATEGGAHEKGMVEAFSKVWWGMENPVISEGNAKLIWKGIQAAIQASGLVLCDAKPVGYSMIDDDTGSLLSWTPDIAGTKWFNNYRATTYPVYRALTPSPVLGNEKEGSDA